MVSAKKGGIEISEPVMGRSKGFRSQPLAGMLFFIGGAQFLLFTTVAESLYPKYSTRDNFLSDLGALQPSATVWNTSIFLIGLLIAASAYPFLFRLYPRKWITVLYLLAGAGAMGTGIFNEVAFPIPHQIASFTAFIFGGVSAVVSYRLIKGPFRLLSIIMGLITLSTLALWLLGLNQPGNGLMERMVAFPEVIWLIGFGGYLMGTASR